MNKRFGIIMSRTITRREYVFPEDLKTFEFPVTIEGARQYIQHTIAFDRIPDHRPFDKGTKWEIKNVFEEAAEDGVKVVGRIVADALEVDPADVTIFHFGDRRCEINDISITLKTDNHVAKGIGFNADSHGSVLLWCERLLRSYDDARRDRAEERERVVELFRDKIVNAIKDVKPTSAEVSMLLEYRRRKGLIK